MWTDSVGQCFARYLDFSSYDPQQDIDKGIVWVVAAHIWLWLSLQFAGFVLRYFKSKPHNNGLSDFELAIPSLPKASDSLAVGQRIARTRYSIPVPFWVVVLSVAIWTFTLGYFVGQEHLKYKIFSAIESVAKNVLGIDEKLTPVGDQKQQANAQSEVSEHKDHVSELAAQKNAEVELDAELAVIRQEKIDGIKEHICKFVCDSVKKNTARIGAYEIAENLERGRLILDEPIYGEKYIRRENRYFIFRNLSDWEPDQDDWKRAEWIKIELPNKARFGFQIKKVEHKEYYNWLPNQRSN